jgi:hypothetical protein
MPPSPDLSPLVAAREAAWADLDALQRDLPACEHVRAWQAEVRGAQARHRETIRAVERAMTEAAKGQRLELGEPLFELGEAS